MIGSWLGIALVLVIFGALLAVLGRTSYRHHPEVARKALHVGMGLVTLSFPWLFSRTWPVLLLACVTLLILLGLRARCLMARNFGRALNGVARASHGEIWFVLGTCAVFMLAAGDALIFCVSMLILTFADAAAALAGTWSGRHRYPAWQGEKTAAGSAAFFVVALCCTYLPLALLAPGAGIEHLITAVLVAGMTTILEAVAGRGLDNLLVPVGAYAALKSRLLSAAPTGAADPGPATPMALFSAAALIALFLALLACWLRAPNLSQSAGRIE